MAGLCNFTCSGVSGNPLQDQPPGVLGTDKRMIMTIQQAQQQVDQWIKTTGVRYFSELTNMALLTEEVGELARIIARRYGEQSEKETDKNKDLGDEMADVLWVLICLANQTGVNLTEAFQKNMEKKTLRDKDRHHQNPKLQ
jgi:NTP pyrophosphatase (non-canonical NTP hydrolase)